jgi:hypothetical protein
MRKLFKLVRAVRGMFKSGCDDCGKVLGSNKDCETCGQFDYEYQAFSM